MGIIREREGPRGRHHLGKGGPNRWASLGKGRAIVVSGFRTEIGHMYMYM